MQHTVYTAQASSDVIIYSDPANSGVGYNLTKESSSYPSNLVVPSNAIIRNVDFYITDTYQYSAHRYAKAMHYEFAEDMGGRFTTSGTSASTNVHEELMKKLYNSKKFYLADTVIPIRIKGDGNDSGYSAGAVFRILAGAYIQIIVDWDIAVQPWQKAGNVWHKHIFWSKFNGVWYRTFSRQRVGGIWK